MNKFQTVVLNLIKTNGATTTNEIMSELISLYPSTIFYRTDVKMDLADMVQNNLIAVIADNGTYRTYSIPVIYLTMSQMCNKLDELEKESIVIDFKDKQGVLNTDRVFTVGKMNALGYREFNESGNFKQLNPRRVKKIVHNNTTYILKSK